MKTVIGEVRLSKPISLKKATSTLSTFVSTENGASPAVCAYLRRALASFKDLRQHEKELGGTRSEQRHYRPKSETLSDVSQARSHKQIRDWLESNITGGNGIERDEKPTRIVVSGQEMGQGVGDEGKREKHWKNKQKGEFGKFGESRGTEIKVKIKPEENPGGSNEGNVGMESETKKHKMKKIFAEEIIKEESKEIGLADSYSVEPKSYKRKKEEKKEINEGGDFKNNGIAAESDYRGRMGIVEVKEEESKKRKNKEVEEIAEDISEEQRDKNKKKRRKTE
ncbi:uncharacterized protein LOC132163598 [Corylus avellana]|uniref:uncharacterized protein LOC132163598 n=1 Tax=Corylus avellana TaxID=13451 RepID=UPI001E1EEF8A|nr:uncharacterized protein LOC132163598 [Corylus avellana]